jgi:predicted esterase
MLPARTIWLGIAAVLLCLSHPSKSAADPGDFRVEAAHQQRIGGLILTEQVIQEGPDPLERFTVHRLRREQGPSRGAILLLPGGGSNFALYSTNPDGRLERSFAGVLASAGYDVWGYSPRTRGLAPGACDTLDCGPMRHWGIDRVVADATYIRGRIRAVHRARKPVIGGWSLGAITALAVVNAHPGDYAGLLAWEGMLFSADPAIRSANATNCAADKARLVAGELGDEASYPIIRQLYDLAVASPEALSAFPGFPAGFTNLQAFYALLTTPQPSPPAYVPGYTLLAGDPFAGFRFSTVEGIGSLIAQLNHYEPIALMRDYDCAIAGERRFSRHLDRFTAPVFAVRAGHGFGPYMLDNLAALGSTDITDSFAADFAHGDFYAAADRQEILDRPILRWLRRVL